MIKWQSFIILRIPYSIPSCLDATAHNNQKGPQRPSLNKRQHIEDGMTTEMASTDPLSMFHGSDEALNLLPLWFRNCEPWEKIMDNSKATMLSHQLHCPSKYQSANIGQIWFKMSLDHETNNWSIVSRITKIYFAMLYCHGRLCYNLLMIKYNPQHNETVLFTYNAAFLSQCTLRTKLYCA